MIVLSKQKQHCTFLCTVCTVKFIWIWGGDQKLKRSMKS